MSLQSSILGVFVLTGAILAGADNPYFVTYSHQMEEPGNLEFAYTNTTARPAEGNRFMNTLGEFEYGIKGWWTTEVYLHGQTTFHDSTVWTGWRWENRFRLLPREHWINPVLYLEYTGANGADRSLREIVGFDGEDDLTAPNDETRREHKREIEAKLLL